MDSLNLPGSYFGLDNPLRWFERRRHGMRHRQRVRVGDRWLELRWTKRAERALMRRDTPLIVELQLLFSCVVKKRVLFHETAGFARVRATPRLDLAFRPVASAACDPLAFARDYPVGREIDDTRAARMTPRWAEIDCRDGCWQGSFGY